MLFRLTLLAAIVVLSGCGESTPTVTQPQANGTKPSPLPPEVEHDPATAAEQYKASQKKHRK